MKRLHVVNFSGGLCSFWAAWRVVERHGAANTRLLFADTLIEDPELYDFNEHASRILGVPITRVSLEMDPWTLFEQQGLIGNNRFPICSVKLKRDQLDAWHEANCLTLAQESSPQTTFDFLEEHRRPATFYIGFDWTEENRLADIRREKPFWLWEAPMTEAPYWDKKQMQREAEALGLKIPLLYRLGFPHNNCGGRCVRAGLSHWVHLLRVLPERFLEWEEAEWHCAQMFRIRGIEPLSILRDRRGGTTKNLYLRDLRLRVEAGEEFTRFDWGGCGCGGATLPAVVKNS